MSVSTLIEPIPGRGYRVSTRNPVEITVEAESREEAIREFQAVLRARLAAGAEIIDVDADDGPNPWIEYAGDLVDDPLLEDWKQAMSEYRDQVDREQAEREAEAS